MSKEEKRKPMDWRMRKKKEMMKHIHPSIQNEIAVVKRIADGEKIVDGGFNRSLPKIDWRCKGIKPNGERCSKNRRFNSRFCWQHK